MKGEKPLEDYPCYEKDPGDPKQGVLLSDEIERLANQIEMITPFNPVHLKPAGYELTIGNEYAIGGKVERLDPNGNQTIKIPPFQVAILSTAEVINLPRFLIARWNLRIKCVYKGLLWSGALQVDAGYVGHLFCPIYNLSNQEIELKLGDPFVLMDFVRTTPFTLVQQFIWEHIPGEDDNKVTRLLSEITKEDWNSCSPRRNPENNTISLLKGANTIILRLDKDKTKVRVKKNDEEIYELTAKSDNGLIHIYKGSISYPRPPRRTKIQDYNVQLQSALFSMVGERIKEIDKKVNQFEGRLNTSIAAILTSITIIIAAFSMFVTSTKEATAISTQPYWFYLNTALSVIAIVLAAYVITKPKIEEISHGKKMKSTIFTILFVIFQIVLALAIVFVFQRFLITH